MKIVPRYHVCVKCGKSWLNAIRISKCPRCGKEDRA